MSLRLRIKRLEEAAGKAAIARELGATTITWSETALVAIEWLPHAPEVEPRVFSHH